MTWFRHNVLTEQGDQAVAEAAVQAMSAERFDFAFVYFGTVDETGHAHGWLSDRYLEQLARVDSGTRGCPEQPARRRARADPQRSRRPRPLTRHALARRYDYLLHGGWASYSQRIHPARPGQPA